EMLRCDLALDLVQDRAELGAGFADIALDLVHRLAGGIVVAADRRCLRSHHLCLLSLAAHRICSRAHSASSRNVRSVRSGARLLVATSRRPLSAIPAPMRTTTMPTMSAASHGRSTSANPRTAAASSTRSPALAMSPPAT